MRGEFADTLLELLDRQQRGAFEVAVGELAGRTHVQHERLQVRDDLGRFLGPDFAESGGLEFDDLDRAGEFAHPEREATGFGHLEVRLAAFGHRPGPRQIQRVDGDGERFARRQGHLDVVAAEDAGHRIWHGRVDGDDAQPALEFSRGLGYGSGGGRLFALRGLALAAAGSHEHAQDAGKQVGIPQAHGFHSVVLAWSVEASMTSRIPAPQAAQ